MKNVRKNTLENRALINYVHIRMFSPSVRNQNTLNNSKKKNCCRKIKLVLINMHYYCLLQFDALKFFLGGLSTWRVTT